MYLPMAQSRLEPAVIYPVRRGLEPEDKQFDAWVYETPIGGELTTVAVGTPRDTFGEHGIVYYPIYRIHDGAVVDQIGVYEAREDNVPHLLDEDGAVQPDLMGAPVLYPPETPGSSSQEPSTKDTPQTAEEDAAARKAYRAKRGAPWIQKFMRNAGYGLVDNEAGGDCLFAAVRQGLESVGVVVSVSDMREMLASAATQTLFEEYEAVYVAAKAQYDSTAASVKFLAKESQKLRGRMRGASRAAQFALVEQAEGVTARLAEEKSEKVAAAELLEEFAFMKGITTLEALRAVIQTPSYWGDTWAVSTLERLLKIKLVIFSGDAFRAADIDNVLLCGHNNDNTLEREGKFEPRFYILLSLGGGGAASMHYELITYDERRAFTYNQLPYRVRHLILTKCLERQAGPYALIPDFRDAAAGVVPHSPASPDPNRSRSPRRNAVFQIYGRSSGRPRPGEGAGESLGNSDPASWSRLTAIKDWRRHLADDGPPVRDIEKSGCAGGFELDGRKWATVRHYALAARYENTNPEFAAKFSYGLGKDNKLGRDVDVAERVASRRKPRRGDPSAPDPDPGADSQEKAAEDRARSKKFQAGTEARAALIATGNADIRLYRRGAPPVPATGLMALRASIVDGTKVAKGKAT